MEHPIISPEELDTAAYVLTSVDNQWVSRKLLRQILEMRKRHTRLGLDDVAYDRRFLMRAEWHRALITTGQVVMDRAYFYNSDLIRREYAEDSLVREAFKTVLHTSVVVPFLLFSKDTPTSQQLFGARQFDAWKQLCDEVSFPCVRLGGKDDATNDDRVQTELFDRARQWLKALKQINKYGDFARFLRDLSIPPDRGDAFQEYLEGIAAWCYGRPSISREEVYRNFVISSGTEPVEGKYDPNQEREFSSVTKELIDLIHRANLPDAVHRFALVPPDSLDRAVLQEIIFRVPYPDPDDQHNSKKRPKDQLLEGRTYSSEELESLFGWAAPGQLERKNDGLFLASPANLSLAEILRIRDTGKWKMYIGDLRGLLLKPEEFSQRITPMYQHYIQLAEEITRIARERGEACKSWQPGIRLELIIGSARLSTTWDPQAGGRREQPNYKDGFVPDGEARVVALIAIGNIHGDTDQADLDLNLEFLRGNVSHARETLNRLLKALNLSAL